MVIRKLIPPLPLDGILCLSSDNKAVALNTAFSKQCSAPSSSSFVPATFVLPPCFEFSDLPEESVLKALQKVNPWKATGLDDISNYFLKECAAQLARPLQFLFNLSFKSGIFPRQWKVAKIQPLYKQKGDRANPANYRPIALLSAVS